MLKPVPNHVLPRQVEHALGMQVAGATPKSILEHDPFLERVDFRTWLVYVRRLVGPERVEPAILDSAA